MTGGCDTILMGSRGNRGLRRLLLGSRASDVLARSTSTVIIVKLPLRAAGMRLRRGDPSITATLDLMQIIATCFTSDDGVRPKTVLGPAAMPPYARDHPGTAGVR